MTDQRMVNPWPVVVSEQCVSFCLDREGEQSLSFVIVYVLEKLKPRASSFEVSTPDAVVHLLSLTS